MSGSKFRRIAIFGDDYGVEQLLRYVPKELVKCVVAASIRPEYIPRTAELAHCIGSRLLIQPVFESQDYPAVADNIGELKIDLLLCNSYSMVIREDVLRSVGYNAINIHWALLPKNRGPNPVQWAVIKGEAETGVTAHYMQNGIDAGDIIARKAVEIGFEDTWVDVWKKLSEKAEELLRDEIPGVIAGLNGRIRQDESLATSNKRLTEDFPRIDFVAMSDEEVYNLIRAQVKPLKGAFIEHDGERLYFSEFVKYKDIGKLRKKYG